MTVNGLDGSWSDFHHFSENIKAFQKLRSDVRILHLCSKSNGGFQTYHGIDVMGKRLEQEICDWFVHDIHAAATKSYETSDIPSKDLKETYVYFSVVGHSLGGLIAKYALKNLFEGESSFQKWRRSVKGVVIVPCSFMTLCTPHLGARKSKGSLLNGLIMIYARLWTGKTGKELMLEDQESIEEALLCRMADVEGPFVKTTDLFKCTAISCLFHDKPVGFCSSAITATHPCPVYSFSPSNRMISSQMSRFVIHSVLDQNHTNTHFKQV